MSSTTTIDINQIKSKTEKNSGEFQHYSTDANCVSFTCDEQQCLQQISPPLHTASYQFSKPQAIGGLKQHHWIRDHPPTGQRPSIRITTVKYSKGIWVPQGTSASGATCIFHLIYIVYLFTYKCNAIACNKTSTDVTCSGRDNVSTGSAL